MSIHNVGTAEGNPLFIEGTWEAIQCVKGLQIAASAEATRADRLLEELVKTKQELREALNDNGETK